MLREEDVALLVKAAYDDASEAARAAFMARVQPMPVTAWPWSAVQVKACGAAGRCRGRRRWSGDHGPLADARGRRPARAPADPRRGRIGGRGARQSSARSRHARGRGLGAAVPGARPLGHADDRKWIGPQGWVSPSGAARARTPTTARRATADATGGLAPDQIARTAAAATSSFSWRSPAVIAAGATVASTLGVVLFSLRRRGAGVAPQQETP
jgi:hypothetical protein